MTENEYKLLHRRAAIAFNRIAEFFLVRDFRTNQPLTEEDHAERHSIWKSTFLPLDYEDCNQALSDMIDGKIPDPGYDPSNFPAKIRARAMEFSAKRARDMANDRQRQKVSPAGKPWSMKEDKECERAFAYVTARIEGREFADKYEKRAAISDAMNEIWPEGEPHPTFD